jgi:hypothetical protein
LQLKYADNRAEEMANYLSDANRLSGIAEGLLKGHVKPFLADKAIQRTAAANSSSSNVAPANAGDTSPTDIIGAVDKALEAEGMEPVARKRAITLSENTNNTNATALDQKVAYEAYPHKREKVLGPRPGKK